MTRRAIKTNSYVFLSIVLAFFSSHSHASDPTGENVVLAASMLGLDAETLAILDVRGGEVTTLLDRLQNQYDEFDLYRESSSEMHNAMAEMRAQDAILRLEPDNAEASTKHQQAITEVSSAIAAMTTYRTSLILDLLEGLADTPPINRVLFANGRINRLPAAYRLAVSTETAADRLAWALHANARSQATNQSTPSSALSELSAAHTQGDVQLARARATAYTITNQNAIDLWVLNN